MLEDVLSYQGPLNWSDRTIFDIKLIVKVVENEEKNRWRYVDESDNSTDDIPVKWQRHSESSERHKPNLQKSYHARNTAVTVCQPQNGVNFPQNSRDVRRSKYASLAQTQHEEIDVMQDKK